MQAKERPDRLGGARGFARAPLHAILLNRALKDAEKLLAVLLVWYARDDGYCFPGQERLAADLGWTVKKVQRALAGLERNAAIRKERRGFMKTNRYVLLFDPSGGHRRRVLQDTSVPHDATPVSHHYKQLLRDSRLKAVPPDDFSYSSKERKRRSYPNREEVVLRFREQLAAAGGGSDMERAVAVALSARLKCSLEEAFQLLGDGQGDVERG